MGKLTKLGLNVSTTEMDCVIIKIVDAYYFIASVGDVEQLGGVVAEDQLLPLLSHLLS